MMLNCLMLSSVGITLQLAVVAQVNTKHNFCVRVGRRWKKLLYLGADIYFKEEKVVKDATKLPNRNFDIAIITSPALAFQATCYLMTWSR